MRQTILLLTAALAVLPALAFASAPRAARYEAYPAARWRAVTPAEQSALNRAVFGHDNVDSMLAIWKTDTSSHHLEALDLGLSWAAVDTHPGLSLLMPGALVLRRDRHFIGVEADVAALLDGRLYDRWSFDQLLRAAGCRGEPRDVTRVARAAVLWGLVQRQAVLHNQPGGVFDLLELVASRTDSLARATAIPAVMFESVGRLRPYARAGAYQGCVVKCLVDGRPTSYRVVFEDGKAACVFEGASDDSVLVGFRVLVLDTPVTPP